MRKILIKIECVNARRRVIGQSNRLFLPKRADVHSHCAMVHKFVTVHAAPILARQVYFAKIQNKILEIHRAHAVRLPVLRVTVEFSEMPRESRAIEINCLCMHNKNTAFNAIILNADQREPHAHIRSPAHGSSFCSMQSSFQLRAFFRWACGACYTGFSPQYSLSRQERCFGNRLTINPAILNRCAIN